MLSLTELTAHVRTYGRTHRSLWALALTLALWALFDGLVTYVTPLAISQVGISDTVMGLIIGSSSMTGALFDVVLCRFATRTTYRHYFLGLFLVSAIYPLVLAQATTVTLFLVAMALWAIYFDFMVFGKFDFVGRAVAPAEHAASFGVLEVFMGLGYLTAPLIAGLLVDESVGHEAFLMMWAVLALAMAAYGAFLWTLRRTNRRTAPRDAPPVRRRSFLLELGLWRRLGRRLLPVLTLTLFLNLTTGLFWTIGPLFAESLLGLNQFAGLFLTAYELPIILVGWFVGTLTSRFGKKRTAFAAAGLGAALLGIVGLTTAPLLLIGTVFVAAACLGIAEPAIDGAYADYIGESHGLEPEIEALQDFFGNLGYIVGPVAGGILADTLDRGAAFSVIGVAGALLMVVLLLETPRHLRVSDLSQT